MTQSPSHKHGGMTPVPGVLLWMATSSSDWTDEEGESAGQFCAPGCGCCLTELQQSL